MKRTDPENWGSRMGLILAMAGNAVGLGNFLRFPVQAVQNGGGAFIIPYLVCFLLMGIPLLWIEWGMGRFGGRSGQHSPPFILASFARNPFWKYAGVFGIFTNVAVAAYYCYIESWTLSYSIRSVSGFFHGMSETQVVGYFDQYTRLQTQVFGLPGEALIFFVICVVLNTLILSRGLRGVERASKVAMPLLILFAVLLVAKILSIEPDQVTGQSPRDGMNFLWTPEFNSLLRPRVWLAAAGQIFFTLSVGMGTVHCYASYLRSRDDVALNAVSAGFTNEFVEVVLGSMIVVPIAAGYLGLDWLREHISFGSAFQTLPFLFSQWGRAMGAVAGLMWFGLLFFAGITSSLAMGMPWISFLRDRFGWKQGPAAFTFGAIVLLLGIPTVLFYHAGVFDEYDYWAGTVSLVVFALLETILFSWVFGIDKGWKEINLGAEIRIPSVYRFIMKFVTPLLLLLVFVGSVFTPVDNDWISAFGRVFHGEAWMFDASSLIRQLSNSALRQEILSAGPDVLPALKKELFLVSGARILLLATFAGITLLVFLASRKKSFPETSAP
ncbi:MAG: sodium-dependent transporter [Bacteroidales bacterium]